MVGGSLTFGDERLDAGRIETDSASSTDVEPAQVVGDPADLTDREAENLGDLGGGQEVARSVSGCLYARVSAVEIVCPGNEFGNC
jgi:hypothetical protein